MSLALVEQLNFEKNMPIDGNCQQEIAVCVPATGSGDYYAGSYFLLNIPRTGPSHVYDPMNSFLRFNVTNMDNQILTPDHSADSFIQKVEVLHAGNVLETIDNYGVLSSMLLDCQVDVATRSTSLNMTKGCSSTSKTISATAIPAHGSVGNSVWYSLTLISGICGSLCRNYIPVNDLQGLLQLRITFAHPQKVGAWADTPTTKSDLSLKFTNIEYHANMIRLSEPILAMVKAQNYTIYSETYTNFQQSIAATTQLEQLIPTRYSSLKTLLLCQRTDACVSNSDWKGNPNTRSSFGISDFCLRLGSTQIPPSRIRGTNYGFIECYEMLKTAFHCGGNALVSMGALNATNYIVPSASDLSGLFVLGIDLESYSGRSGALLSGISTLSTDLIYSSNYILH